MNAGADLNSVLLRLFGRVFAPFSETRILRPHCTESLARISTRNQPQTARLQSCEAPSDGDRIRLQGEGNLAFGEDSVSLLNDIAQSRKLFALREGIQA